MKKRLISLLLLAAMLLPVLMGCAPETVIKPPSPDEQLYTQLFDYNNKIEINVRMTEAEVAKLQKDYDKYKDQSPIYRKADLDVTITLPNGEKITHTIEEVGVRTKGTSYSASPFYSKSKGIYSLIHMKINFQETFDDPEHYGKDVKTWEDPAAREARKNRTFATLEKLDMKWNRSDDPTYIRESYCVDVFRANDILAPRTNISSIDWAGLHLGVYTIYEPVDKVFLERNLPAAAQGGNLYKCAYQTRFNGKDSIGVEDELAGKFYQFDLKTNKKTADHTQLNNLISALNDGIPTKEKLAELFDMENFLTYCAVSYFIGNGDDMRNDTNNVYIYFRPNDGKAIIIPHDFDRGLGVTGGHKSIYDNLVTENPFGFRMAWLDERQENPVFLYTVCEGGYYVKEFAEEMKKVAKHEMFTEEVFNARYAVSEALYKKDAKPSKTFENAKGKNFTFDRDKSGPVGGAKNMSFSVYIKAKMKTFERYMEKVDDYVGGPFRLPTNFYLQTDLGNWANLDAMELGIVKDGVYGLKLTIRNKASILLYDKTNKISYGYSKLSSENTVPCTKGEKGSFVLPKGTYYIQMEKGTKNITILKEA